MDRKVVIVGVLSLLLVSSFSKEKSEAAISVSTGNDVVINQRTATKENAQEMDNQINIIRKHYTKGYLSVDYPQLSGGDVDKEKTINSVIAKEATYFFENGFYEGYSGDIKYKTTFLSDEVVSFTYQGLITSPIQSYPVHLFYSTIINMKTGKKETLSDLVTIDDTFVKAFKEGEILSISSSEYTNEVKEYISTLSNEELLHLFSQADKMDISSAFTYLTADSIVVAIGVPHALGDFIQIEIPKNKIHHN